MNSDLFELKFEFEILHDSENMSWLKEMGISHPRTLASNNENYSDRLITCEVNPKQKLFLRTDRG